MTTIDRAAATPLDAPGAGEGEDDEAARTFAGEALATEGDARALARRATIGLALASIAGLAMGARQGLPSMGAHAAGVPLALIAVVALGVPSLYVVLALVGASLEPRRALAAAGRGIAASGLVLAGLAPAVALFVVTSAGAGAAALSSAAALALGGAIGLGHLAREVHGALSGAAIGTRIAAAGALAVFGVFAVVLAARVWGALLPVLIGGAS